jgi:hypothetical protein
MMTFVARKIAPDLTELRGFYFARKNQDNLRAFVAITIPQKPTD